MHACRSTLEDPTGQSNCPGRGDYHTLTDSSLATPQPNCTLKQKLAATNDNALTWTTYATDSVQPRSDSATENMGIELKLAKYLDAIYPKRFAYVKMGVGASDLHVNWKPTGTYPGSQPNLFTQAMTFAKDAETELNGKVAAFIWIQGEADATDSTKSSNYQANMIALLAAIRAQFPGVPFLFNRLNSASPATFASTIRTAQTNFLADGASTQVTQVASDGAQLQGDNVHYTADGYVELGRRFAIATAAALGFHIPPVADFSSATTGLSVAFTDLSTSDDSTIVAWDWDWGDGTAHGTTQNPTHVYATGATRGVTLTVTDAHGMVKAVTKNVTSVNATWEVDATSNKAVPATAQHFTDLLNNFAISMVAPQNILGCQESSGALADLVGTLSMTASGSPLYQQSVSGWTRKAVGCADGGASQRFSSTQSGAGLLPDISTTSCLILAYCIFTGNPATARSVFGLGTGGTSTQCEARAIATPEYRATSGNNAATSGNNAGTSVVRPVLLKLDRTNSVVKLYTDLDVLTPTFASGMTGVRLQIGAAGASSAPVNYLYFAIWTGSNAEISDATARSLLQALGWTIPW